MTPGGRWHGPARATADLAAEGAPRHEQPAGAQTAGAQPAGAQPAGAQPSDERGSGVLGTSFGILFFLGFLLLATQVAVSLYARTAVHSAALDAGRLISQAAGADGILQPGELAAAELAARRRVADLLGSEASLSVDSVDVSANRVTVSVRAPQPRLLLGGGTLGTAVLRETVELRLETLQ